MLPVCLVSLAVIIADLTLQSQSTGSLLVPSVHNEKCLIWDKVASFNKGGATLRQILLRQDFIQCHALSVFRNYLNQAWYP